MELKRQLLEQLGGIEAGLCERVIKNPRWVPATYTSLIRNAPYISARDAALRRVEAGVLVAEYVKLAEQLDSLNSVEADKELVDLDAELSKVTKNEAPATNLSDQFKLVRGNCEFTKNITLNYPPEEMYGETLYLEPFYTKQLATSVKPKNYIEYLESISDYLTPELCTYLRSFHARALEVGPAPIRVPKRVNTNSLYCDRCERTFAKQTVYNAHLTGKKHRSRKGNTDIHAVIANLEPVIAKTVANIRRKSGMTVQERQLEVESLKEREIEDEYTNDESESEQFVKPLLGPEGTPIPRWLFRLKGLRNWHACEICSAKFQGRRAFDRHFDDPKHVQGLARLGITTYKEYRGIAVISEAKQLYKTLRRNAVKTRCDAEIEDADGTVMTAQMYADLKKQGLI